MEQRTLLAIILSLVVLLAFQYLFNPPTDQEPPRPSAPVEDGTQTTTSTKQAGQKGEVLPSREPLGLEASSTALGGEPARPARDVEVKTDLYHLVFTEDGARLKQFLLRDYRTAVNADAPPLDLIRVSSPTLPLGVQVETQPPIDLSRQLFIADRDSIDLQDGQAEATLTFSADLANGTKITKAFTFHKGTYWIDLDIRTDTNGQIQNSPPVSLEIYNRPSAEDRPYVFIGPAYSTQQRLEQVKLKKAGEEHTFVGPLDWLGYDDYYFLSAIIPKAHEGPWQVRLRKEENAAGLVQGQLTALSASSEGDAHASQPLSFGLYWGPKELDHLNALDHDLAGAVDFGWFDPIAKPLLHLLKFFYRYLHNYGVAIILLTVLIKILFWPLAHKSHKSMKTMQKLQPKLAKLKEKYGNDKERMNKELMQLYKTYKVNPVSGCLPMVLQIPVFFALYKVLLQAIEMRHAPFFLWINDLSAPDRLVIPGAEIPFLGGIPVLTLLMGASMFVQQKMSPSSLDPMQAKMMLFLPVVFTFMFINFPSGLVLYWLVNNVLSVAQQYATNRFMS